MSDIEIVDAAMGLLADNPITYDGSDLTIAWPGKSFDPPTSEHALWLQPSIFPQDSANIVLAAGPVLFRGFVQILVGFRNNPQGVRPAYEVASNIVTLYAKGTDLGPVKVASRPSIGPAVSEQGSARLPQGANFMPITVPYLGLA